MTFAEKLKNLRKAAGFSQEKLAEKLGVSRQAITKWESDAGTPDIENIVAISNLFGISIDELLGREKPQDKAGDFLFESVTEYDIDRPKRYDMKFGGAKRIAISGCEGEKMKVRLASNSLANIQSDFKLRIDDVRERIDVELDRRSGVTEAAAKEALTVFISIPEKYIYHIELAANAESIALSHLKCDDVELEGKIQSLSVRDVECTLEVNCNLDMTVKCANVQGDICLNQISATSRICIPAGCAFKTLVKGIANSVTYEAGGKAVESFSSDEAEYVIELNGMKSELVICKTEAAE